LLLLSSSSSSKLGSYSSRTLRRKHRLRTFENKAQRNTCGPKKEAITAGWIKLRYFYSSLAIIRAVQSRRMRWAGRVTGGRREKDACKVLVRKLEGKIPLSSPRFRRGYNIKMDLKKLRCRPSVELIWFRLRNIGELF